MGTSLFQAPEAGARRARPAVRHVGRGRARVPPHQRGMPFEHSIAGLYRPRGPVQADARG